MHDDDKPTQSVEQDEWVASAKSMREAILKRIEDVPAMKPEEIQQLVSALAQALELFKTASLYDKWLDLELSRSVPAFG